MTAIKIEQKMAVVRAELSTPPWWEHAPCLPIDPERQPSWQTDRKSKIWAMIQKIKIEITVPNSHFIY